jgi:hypothetical protein
MMKVENAWLKLGVSVSTYLMASNAFAQVSNSTDLQGLSANVANQIGTIPKMLSMGAYVAGAGIGMNGVLKLRAHSENPGQTPISHGAGRLAAGGALIALPWVLSNAVNSLGATSTGGSVTGFKTNVL